jgi:hypothetical protein
MALLLTSLLAQVTPEMMHHGPLSPKAMVILAYASMMGVIVGGVIQVLQLFVNSKNNRLEAQLREQDIRAQSEKQIREAQEAARAREMELMKAQGEVLRQQAVWLQGWQTTILNQKPGEPYGHGPTFNPDPETSTPQAMEQSKTLPMVSVPLVETPVPPLVPVPPEVLNPSSSGFFQGNGTPIAPIVENTEALKENTEAVKNASEKL